MNLILSGFKRSGKSYYGEKLAARLGRPFFDTDALLEADRNAHEIYKEIGEAAFRKLETEVLLSLQDANNSIIAVGGGLPLHPHNVALLQKLGSIIYLIVDKETLKARILTDPLPAFIDPTNREESFEQMYQTRKPIYETQCAISIELFGKTDEEILNEIISYGK